MRKPNIKADPSLMALCLQRYKDAEWNDTGNDRIPKLFERLSPLSQEERKLIFQLTDDFIFCNPMNVVSHIFDAYSIIPAELKDNARNIIIVPLKDPIQRKINTIEDLTLAPKSKSADIYYPLFHYTFPTNDPHYQKIVFCDDPKSLMGNYNDGTLLILIDDFVGTGLTVSHITSNIDCLLRKKGKKLRYNDTIILSAFAMNQGVELLGSRYGISCYADKILPKGISGNKRFSREDVVHLLSVMRDIEHKTVPGVGYVNTLGYMQSEALVSIGDKCPNNTFPFYWYGNKKSETLPIFPRNK